MTNSEAVSLITTPLKLNYKDSRISRRYILRTLKSVSKGLISQKLSDRTIAYDYNIYTLLKCFEFEKDEVINCNIIEFRRCNQVMKSVKPLPPLVHSRLGASIKNITSIDGMLRFNIIDVNQYRRNKNRKYTLDNEIDVYIGQDLHLYIPDQILQAVDLELITMETDLIESLSGCGEKDTCSNAWNAKFICPDKLEDTVLKSTLQIVASTYASIIKDSNPNGIDKQPTQ